MARASQTVLITGCSSGIGRATAEHLAREGHTVYATARKPETVQDLAGCKALALDVTDESSMIAAVNARRGGRGRHRRPGQQCRLQPERGGGVPPAGLDPGAVRDQRVRPHPHEPAGAARHARARQRAHREHGLDGGQAHLPGRGHLPRHQARRGGDLRRHALRERGLRSAGGPAAKVVEKALTAKRPRARYTVTPSARIFLTQRALLPDVLWDRMVGTTFPRPGN